jgi:hypothetical protein
MQHLSTSSPLATIRLGLNRLICLWLDSYRVVIQYITPPYNNQLLNKQVCLLGSLLFLIAAYGRAIVCLFTGQYVPCCTNKYIFWLGKNKFDRRNAILAGTGHRGGSRLGDKGR